MLQSISRYICFQWRWNQIQLKRCDSMFVNYLCTNLVLINILLMKTYSPNIALIIMKRSIIGPQPRAHNLSPFRIVTRDTMMKPMHEADWSFDITWHHVISINQYTLRIELTNSSNGRRLSLQKYPHGNNLYTGTAWNVHAPPRKDPG